MSVQASVVVNTVRDLITDPVYDSNNTAQPAVDGGLFKCQTLYRWINDAVKSLAEQVGWVVKDWTAFAVTASQPNYSLNGSWAQVDEGFQSSYRLTLTPETTTLWQKQIVSGQPYYYSQHRATDHLEVGLFPVPNVTDPTTTLTSAITSSVTTGFPVASNAGFLNTGTGYVQIDSEILFYAVLAGSTGVTILQRGQCGTTAAAHANAATVTHLSAWFKGSRMPLEVATATDVIELPAGFLYAVQEYVLSKCSYAQEDQSSGKLHMDEFRKECARIYADPNWRGDSQGVQIAPYGSGGLGRTVWGPFGVIVP